jgi:hypothetical protein
MARLSGWKRIGIIVSVVWILGAGIFTYNERMNYYLSLQFPPNAKALAICNERENEARDRRVKECNNLASPQFGPCMKGYDADSRERRTEECYSKNTAAYLPTSRKAALTGSAILAFVPLPLGWGFVYLILFLVAWVKRGFI